MTPEQIAEAGQRLAWLEQEYADEAGWRGGLAITARFRVIAGESFVTPDWSSFEVYSRQALKWALRWQALALAQQALREWVPREDKMDGLRHAAFSGMATTQGIAGEDNADRHWKLAQQKLKLEDTP